MKTKLIHWIPLFVLLLLLGMPGALQAQKKLTWGEHLRLLEQKMAEGSVEAAKFHGEEALRLARLAEGQNSLAEATSLLGLANVDLALGDQENALQRLEKAYGILKQGHQGSQVWVDSSQALGQMYSAQGEYEKADFHYTELFGFMKKTYGLKDPNTLSMLFTLAQIKEVRADYLTAEQHFRLGLEQISLAKLEDPVLYLTGLEGLAAVERKMGRLGDSREHYLQALGFKENVFGKNSLDAMITHRELGALALQAGNFPEAKSRMNIAVAGMEPLLANAENQDELYLTYASLAEVLEALGDYTKAEELFKKVMDYDVSNYGEEDIGAIADLNNLAGIYSKQGKLAEAEEAYKKALERMRNALGPAHPETLSLQNNLALLYENMGFFEESEPLIQDAVSKAKAQLGVNHPKTLDMMNNLAMLHESQGLFDRAEGIYREVIMAAQQTLGKDNIKVTTARNNLAYLYLIQQNYKLAINEFKEVVTIWSAQLGPKHQKTLKAKNSYGRTLMGMGKLSEANLVLEEALASRQEVFGVDHPDSIRSQIDVGALKMKMGQLDQAETFLLNALSRAEARLGVHHQYTFDAMTLLAELRQRQGKSDQSLMIHHQIFERRNDFFSKVLWGAGDQTRQGYISLHKPEQDRFLAALVKSKNPQAPEMALEVSLKRKGLLLQITSGIQKILTMQQDPQLSVLATDLYAKQKALSEMTLAGPQDLSLASYNKKMKALEDEVESAQRLLGKASQTFQNNTKTVEVADLMQSMPKDHSLMDFIVYEDEGTKVMGIFAQRREQSCYVVWTCSKVTVKIVPLGKEEHFRENVTYFRMAIQDDESDPIELEALGEDLYTQLWKPIEKDIKLKSPIYLVPDGVLHLLPFDAVPSPEGGYLFQQYRLKVISSARDVVLPLSQVKAAELVIFAGPDFDLQADDQTVKQVAAKSRSALKDGINMAPEGLRSLSFDPLFGAKVEGETVKTVADKHQTKSTIYIERVAEEQVLRDLAHPPQMLHVATHGFFLEESNKLKLRLMGLNRGGEIKQPPPADNPLLRAGLAFAGINSNAPFLGEIDTDNDGILTAMEVMTLNFQGTELVVLSACETGVGEIHAGEGVYGLRRAFQESGASNVVSSLWPVSDEATKLLMSRFYQEMFNGKIPREALRLAQNALVDSEDFNHPYYWASFVLVGKQ